MSTTLSRPLTLKLLMMVLILITSSDQVRATDTWRRVQNGSQGYILECPESATVWRYEPEGILHIVLPFDHQPMMVHVHSDLTGLVGGQALTEPYAELLVQSVLEDLGTPARCEHLDQLSIGGTAGIAIELPGVLKRYRVVVWPSREHVYSISYPLGTPENEAIFAQIVETIRPTESREDQGLDIVQTDRSTITDIPVPNYYQNDDQWRCDQIGDCTAYDSCEQWKWACDEQPTILTIGDIGCTISSYAMIFEYYTPAHFMTPLELDTCYTAHGEYGDFGGCGSCGRPWWNLNQSVCKPGDVTYVGDNPTQAEVDADLQAGYPLMGELPGHYVVIVGKSGADYHVNNPVIGGLTTYAFGDFSNFVRFRGPMPGGCHCCGVGTSQQGSLCTTSACDAVSLPPASVAPPGLVPPVEPGELYSHLEDPTLSSPSAESAMPEPAVLEKPVPPFDKQAPTAVRAPVEPQRAVPKSAHFRIPRSVFGSGGGLKTSAHYVLNGTQGQATDLHQRQSAHYVLVPGYWSPWTPTSYDYQVYLPLVIRNH